MMRPGGLACKPRENPYTKSQHQYTSKLFKSLKPNPNFGLSKGRFLRQYCFIEKLMKLLNNISSHKINSIILKSATELLSIHVSRAANKPSQVKFCNVQPWLSQFRNVQA